jgi:DNA polymerase I-like protein with 3'-5' exonuclease and polymerase domains
MPVTLNLSVPNPEFIDTDEQAQDFLGLCLHKVATEPGEFIGFDTETTGKKMPFTVGTKKPLDWMSDLVTFWSLSFVDRGVPRRFCLRGEHFRGFAPLLENPDAWFAGWNAKYDGHVSWNMGINIWNAHVVDGLALIGMHDENRIQRGLKACAEDLCGLPMTKYQDLFGDRDEQGNKIKEYETSLHDLPIGKVIDYASYDAYAHLVACCWLRDRLLAAPINNKLDEQGNYQYTLWHYFLDMEVDITRVLWRIERRGMPVDLDYLKAQVPIISNQILELEQEINRAAGRPINVQAHQQLSKYFFNSRSDGGLGLTPVKMTPGNIPSVDEEVMGLLTASGHEVAQKIVACRKLYKIKSTYIDTLIALASYYDDHRIHPNFNQFGARTGRFSTDVPNSQNFPRPDNDEFGIRKAFKAPDGFKFIVPDYEQLEMRIMAHMSGDPKMIAAIQEGKDLHSFTVSLIEGLPYEAVVAAKKAESPTPEQKKLKGLRQDYKAIGFGIIYGAGPPKIAQQIDIPEEEVAAKREEMKRSDNRLHKKFESKKKRNPLLTSDQIYTHLAREAIAADKIASYFAAFPNVKQYMDQVPEECRTLMVQDFWGKPRFRPSDPVTGIPIMDSAKYDWDTTLTSDDSDPAWMPGAINLTRTGHTKEFGIVQTLCGRYRRLEDITHTSYLHRGEAERQAVNTTIQGSASDIIKAAMLRIENNRRLKELVVEMVNQVHDELVLTCPEENVEEASKIVKECMEHPFAMGKEALVVPLPVDLKVVDRWNEAKG